MSSKELANQKAVIAAIKAARSGRGSAGQIEHRISAPPGLVLRIGSRSATYTMRLRLPGQGQVRRDIGPAEGPSAISLKQAREEAERLRLEAKGGRLHKVRDPERSVDALVARFLQRFDNKSTLRTYTSLARNHVSPQWGRKAAAAVTAEEIQAYLNSLQAGGEVYLAQSLHGFLTSLFKFGASASAGWLSASPMARVDRPAGARSRDHVPTDADVRAIWAGASDFGGPGGALIRFLMCTGLRRSAAASLEWAWVNWDSGIVTVPRGTAGLKHKASDGEARDFVLPLNDMAIGILQNAEAWQQANGAEGRFVFSFDGKAPINSFNWIVDRVRICAWAAGHDFGEWRLHDFRRLLQTRAAEAEADEPIGHGGLAQAAHVATGHRPGDQVMRTYNRASLVPVRRRALTWWGEYLASILADDQPDAVPQAPSAA